MAGGWRGSWGRLHFHWQDQYRKQQESLSSELSRQNVKPYNHQTWYLVVRKRYNFYNGINGWEPWALQNHGGGVKCCQVVHSPAANTPYCSVNHWQLLYCSSMAILSQHLVSRNSEIIETIVLMYGFFIARASFALKNLIDFLIAYWIILLLLLKFYDFNIQFHLIILLNLF